MKRKFVILVLYFCLLAGADVFAQQAEIDSLETVLKNSTEDDHMARVLMRLSELNTYVDFERATKYAERAVELAEKTDNGQLKYRAYQGLASNYSFRGDYTTALKYETNCLRFAIEENDSSSLGLSHSNIGNYYHELGEYDEAYYYLTQAYRILQESARDQEDSLYMNIALHNVGRVFKELGQYDFALQHLRLSQKVSEQVDDADGLPYSMDEIGDVKLRMKDYDSALYYLTRALKETRVLLAEDPESQITELLPKTLHKIAKTYLRQGDYATALTYYDSTRKIHELTNNTFGIGEVELGVGSVLLLEGKYDEAIDTINEALSKAKSVNARVLEQNCYTHLSELWEKKGDFKKALDYYKQYTVLNDSLFSQEMQQKLFRDQLRFATQSKDDQIRALIETEETQKSKIRNQELIRNILVVIVALTGILLITVYRSGQRRRRINMLLLQHQEEMERRSEELEKLNQVKDKFFSIISHDLRSPINALSGILDLMDKGAIHESEMPMAIRELKTRFAHTRTLMNNLLDWTLLQMDKLNINPSNVGLRDIVQENLDMAESLHGKNITLVNNVPTTAVGFIDSNTINLVIRNLMTNAIKFTNDGGTVEVAAEEKPGFWVLSVKDNGVGIDPDIQQKLFDKINPYSTRGTANEKGTGLGLILCKEFVEKNGGKIWVESKPGQGSTFWFTVPKEH